MSDRKLKQAIRQAKTLEAMVAPSNLNALDTATEKVKLTWQDNSSNEDAFHLVCDKKIGSDWVRLPLIRVPANATSYVHASGVGHFRYQIRSAKCVNNVVYKSELSNPVEVSVYKVPDVPTDVTTRVQNSTISVGWRYPINVDMNFHVMVEKLDPATKTWSQVSLVRVPTLNGLVSVDAMSYEGYKTGKGTYRCSVRAAYSVGSLTYKSAFSPTTVIEVP